LLQTTEKKKLVVLRKTSFVDYPGCISAVIFFPGCNLRCPWCYNGELALGTSGSGQAVPGYISLEDTLNHIEKRRTVLGGAVLSGGEPTLFSGLGAVIGRIKSLGLRVKLDTNGLLPGVLENLFGTEETRPNYIAMDLKTAPERYRELLPDSDARAANPGEDLKRSAALIRSFGIAHEFRSITLPASPNGSENTAYFGERDRAALAVLAGDSPWHIRPFVPGNCLDPAWNTAEAVHGEAETEYGGTEQ
jgi:pyruvate formate lyase activating enzyme